MNPEERMNPVEDAQVEAALRNFRASIRDWSEREYVRPRWIARTRWSRFRAAVWHGVANPALAGTLAAALLATLVGVPIHIHQERAVAAQRQAALEFHRKQMAEQAQKAAMAATSQIDDGAFLDDVDSDIAQATPDAMQPLASLMDESSGKSSRR